MANVGSVFGKEDVLLSLDGRNQLQQRPFYYPSRSVEVDANLPKFVGCKEARNAENMDMVKENSTSSASGEIAPRSIIQSTSATNIRDVSSGSSKYNESWDTSPRETVLLPVNQEDFDDISVQQLVCVNSREHSIEDFLEQNYSNGIGTDKNKGTIAKLVERFRTEPPQPRSERHGMTTQFWWLHSQHNSGKPKTKQPSSSSTPLSDQSNTTQQQASAHDVTSSLELLEGTSASLKGKENISPVVESDIERIQQRASKLLELSTTSSGLSSMLQKFPHQKKLVKSSFKQDNSITEGVTTNTGGVIEKGQGFSVESQLAKKTLRPEEDILYQWRLNRKIELAKFKQQPNPFLSQATFEKILVKENMPSNNSYVASKSHPENEHEQNSKENSFTQDSTKIESQNIETSRLHNQNSDNLDKTSLTNDKLLDQRKEDRVSHYQNHDENARRQSQKHVCDFCFNNQLSQTKYPGCTCSGSQDYSKYPQNYFIPPHVHDICDIIPCVHGNRNSSTLPAQYNKQVLQDENYQKRTSECANANIRDKIVSEKGEVFAKTKNLVFAEMGPNTKSPKHDENYQKKTSECANANIRDKLLSEKGEVFTKTKNFVLTEMRPNTKSPKQRSAGTNGSIAFCANESNVDNVGPIIQQVVSGRLFQETVVTETSKPNSQTDPCYISDGEFSDDEILQDLRKRRKFIENKLKRISDALNEDSVSK